jgi:hypothetical protein
LHRRNDPEAQAESERWSDWFKDFIAPQENPFEPVVTLIYPVVNNIRRVDLLSAINYTTANDTVAILGAYMYWRDLIRDILPTGSN